MNRSPRRLRRGAVLVAALGLLMLAAALLAGSAVASVELRRATRGLTAGARADAEGRRGLGEVVQRWDGAADSLAIGGVLERDIPSPGLDGLPTSVNARVRRLTESLYAASVTVRVGDTAKVLAARRIRLVLWRTSSPDSAAPPPRVAPLARWSLVELR